MPSPSNDVAAFRQPMITSIGILMGFLLNFIAGWSTTEDNEPAIETGADMLVAGSMLAALALMILVLSRLLSNRVPADRAGAHYAVTFRIYLAAILLAFAGFGAALFI